MGNHALNRRDYGCRYYQTRTITDLTVLAERILADLPFAGTQSVPAGTEFSIQIRLGVLLHLRVGGLPDEFVFADHLSYLYSDQAKELVGRLDCIMESYNWTNLGDTSDRRFVSSVYLLTESEYRSFFWTSGVVRLL